jgi:NAD(P)-dependent dehydrogenase (short-subunit alcohol dehydrogenase family)
MDLHLEGRVAIVTGGNSGIGLASVRGLAAEGAHVVVGDLNTEALAGDGHANVEALQLDLTERDAGERLARRALEKHGRIDVLVNNVGAAINRTSFLDVSDEQWDDAVNLNLLAMSRATRAVLPTMVEQGSGSVVTIASDGARQPETFFVDYCAAKAGVLNLSKTLSIEFGPKGIRSNAISPGPTRTTQFVEFFEKTAGPEWGMGTEEAIDHFAREICRLPLGHVGEPEDVASAVLYLASDVSRQVTGIELRVDGGVITYV